MLPTSILLTTEFTTARWGKRKEERTKVDPKGEGAGATDSKSTEENQGHGCFRGANEIALGDRVRAGHTLNRHPTFFPRPQKGRCIVILHGATRRSDSSSRASFTAAKILSSSKMPLSLACEGLTVTVGM